MVVWWAVALSGCCGGPAPAWQSTDAIYLANNTVTVDLDTLIDSTRADLEYTVSADPDVVTELDGSLLTLTPQPGWQGETLLLVTATDPCGGIADLDLDVRSGADPDARPEAGPCDTVITYRGTADTEAVAIAGSFNDWSTESHPLFANEDGTWSTNLDLPPGNYPYKLVETRGGAEWRRGANVRLKSRGTGSYLHSHAVRFDASNCGGNCPIMGQQEITGYHAADDENNWWASAEGVYFPVTQQ